MKKIATLVLLLAACVGTSRVYADDVTAFSFITDPQTIDVGATSKEITVQSQASAGIVQPIPETFDLAFTSSSNTGLFLNSSGNPVSTTMSKNTANRSFYYKDSSSGDFVLTVVATGRTSQKSFTVSQHIYVGVPLPAGSSNATTTATTTPDSQTAASSSGSSSISSSHSSPVDLSTEEVQPELEVSAGRDRLAAVGNTLTFQASVTKSKNILEQSTSYQWSFGDGSSAIGKAVNHAYRFPGTYTVVLNAANSDRQAVSRLTVTVFLPVFSLSRVNGGVEVWNKSSNEINLEGWNLSSGVHAFMFPKDTIIRSGDKIVFPDQVLGFVGTDSFQLSNSIGIAYATVTSEPSVSALTFSAPTSDLVAISAKINSLQAQLALVPQNTPAPTLGTVPTVHLSASPSVIKAPKPKVSVRSKAPAASSQTAAAVQVFQAPAQHGIVSTIFSWPIKGFDFVRHLFVEE